MLYQVALKLLTTFLLLFIIVICIRGIGRIWDETSLTFRPFSYTRDGVNNSDAGLHFTQLVNHDLQRLHRLLAPPNAANTVIIIPSSNQQGAQVAQFDLPKLPDTFLPDIQIQAYGIQISTLLSQIAQQITPPNEIIGSVSERNSRFDAYFEVRRSDAVPENSVSASLVSQHATKEEASFAIACRVYQRLAAPTMPLYSSSEAEFEVFARALLHYSLYRVSLAEVRPKDATDAALQQSENLLQGLIAQGTKSPLVFKLAALVADSKGNLEDAEIYLTKYLELFPKKMAKDQNAVQLLADYKKRSNTGKEATTADARQSRQKMRPIRPGVSVSDILSRPGSICCIVKKSIPDGKRFILSADHVLGTTVGSPITQPAVADGGEDNDVVARVTEFIQLSERGENSIAGTLAELDEGIDSTSSLDGVRFSGISTVRPGNVIKKFGRTTGWTRGTITSVQQMKVTIGVPEGIRIFSGLIEAVGADGTPFSQPGDSGAPVVTEEGKLVGMVYAGTLGEKVDRTLILPIEPILKHFEVELVLD